MDISGTDVQQALEYRRTAAIVRLLPTGLLMIFLGLFVFVLADPGREPVATYLGIPSGFGDREHSHRTCALGARKSRQAGRNRGKCEAAVPRALWGFRRGFGLGEVRHFGSGRGRWFRPRPERVAVYDCWQALTSWPLAFCSSAPSCWVFWSFEDCIC